MQKLHTLDQYDNFAQRRSLKQYPSITPELLDSAYTLVGSVARDLAIAFPMFLRRSEIEQTGSASTGLSVGQNGTKRPHMESDRLLTQPEDASSSSSVDVTATKRRKVTHPPYQPIMPSLPSPDASSPRKFQPQPGKPEGQPPATKRLLGHNVEEDTWLNIDPQDLFSQFAEFLSKSGIGTIE